MPIVQTDKTDCDAEEMMRNLEKIPWNDLRPEFRNAIDEACHFSKNIVAPKRVQQKVVTGQIFAHYIKDIVKLVDNDEKVHIANAFEAAIKQTILENLKSTQKEYSDAMDSFISLNKYPLPWAILEKQHSKALDQCVHRLLKNILGSAEQIEKCRKELSDSIESKWTSYYQKNNREAIISFNRHLIESLYEECVQSKLTVFRTAEEVDAALKEFFGLYDTRGFRGEEMQSLKKEFTKRVGKDMESLKKRIKDENNLIEKNNQIQLDLIHQQVEIERWRNELVQSKKNQINLDQEMKALRENQRVIYEARVEAETNLNIVRTKLESEIQALKDGKNAANETLIQTLQDKVKVVEEELNDNSKYQKELEQFEKVLAGDDKKYLRIKQNRTQNEGALNKEIENTIKKKIEHIQEFMERHESDIGGTYEQLLNGEIDKLALELDHINRHVDKPPTTVAETKQNLLEKIIEFIPNLIGKFVSVAKDIWNIFKKKNKHFCFCNIQIA